MSSNECILIGGFFQIVVQFCLCCVCVTTLVIKRHTEHPQRPLGVWFLDALKQSIGALIGHFSNIGLSIVINSSIVNGTSDECLWYCLSFTVDCTIGTGINLLLLYSFEKSYEEKRRKGWGNVKVCIYFLEYIIFFKTFLKNHSSPLLFSSTPVFLGSCILFLLVFI